MKLLLFAVIMAFHVASGLAQKSSAAGCGRNLGRRNCGGRGLWNMGMMGGGGNGWGGGRGNGRGGSGGGGTGCGGGGCGGNIFGQYTEGGADWGPPNILIQNLRDHRSLIQRNMTKTDDGIEAHTWSEDPTVDEWIKQHVAQMHHFMSTGQRIRQRDPLFVAAFDKADKIDFAYDFDSVEKGVHVTESSEDPCAVAIIQAHAETVGKFIEYGPVEMRKNHAVPEECD